jgi:hypothetical protein
MRNSWRAGFCPSGECVCGLRRGARSQIELMAGAPIARLRHDVWSRHSNKVAEKSADRSASKNVPVFHRQPKNLPPTALVQAGVAHSRVAISISSGVAVCGASKYAVLLSSTRSSFQRTRSVIARLGWRPMPCSIKVGLELPRFGSTLLDGEPRRLGRIE